MNININRQLLGVEDILWGVGTAEQTRGGVLGTVTKINAQNIPYDGVSTLGDIVGAISISEWNAEASRLTAVSYATEAENVVVNIVTSNGDGTYTYTPQVGVYSALHHDAKGLASATAAGLSETAAGLSEIASATSETNAQLAEWESIASKLTALSYAEEAEDVVVNVVTSDGDGTYTYTPQVGVYSAKHHAIKAATFNPALYALLTDIGVTIQPYDANTTLAGNTFNGVSQLVQLDVDGKLPAIDGSQLTGISAVGSIDDLTDVDTTTVVPVINDLLTWNGSNWVPVVNPSYTKAEVAANRTTDVTVTVGSGGNFATINLAIEHLTKTYNPTYIKNGFTATISLLTGFVMAEQVIVKGLNLSWITITSVDAIVTITRSALTVDASTTFYAIAAYPAFCSLAGGFLPRIGALFSMDTSGTSTGRHGVMVMGSGSKAEVLASCGVKNAGSVGLLVLYGGIAYARASNFSYALVDGAQVNYGSTLIAFSAYFSHCGSSGVSVTSGSRASLYLANCSYAGVYGIVAIQSSHVDARQVDATFAVTSGIYATQDSMINCYSGNARKNGTSDQATDIAVILGGIVSANSALGGTSVTVNTITANGIIFK